MDIHAIEKTCQEKMNIFIIKIQSFLRRHVKIDPEFTAVMKEFLKLKQDFCFREIRENPTFLGIYPISDRNFYKNRPKSKESLTEHLTNNVKRITKKLKELLTKCNGVFDLKWQKPAHKMFGVWKGRRVQMCIPKHKNQFASTREGKIDWKTTEKCNFI
eukprot:UN24658